MGFDCAKCGACCKLFNPFTGLGRCPRLTADDLCSIYEERPDICRVDEMAKRSGVPIDEYYKTAELSCEALKEVVEVMA